MFELLVDDFYIHSIPTQKGSFYFFFSILCYSCKILDQADFLTCQKSKTNDFLF